MGSLLASQSLGGGERQHSVKTVAAQRNAAERGAADENQRTKITRIHREDRSLTKLVDETLEREHQHLEGTTKLRMSK
jgi:hypothetical protein